MKIDWVEGTITKRDRKESLERLKHLFLGEWIELERGGLGYECSALVLGTGRVYWSIGRPEMGVHVVLPSKALDRLEVTMESILSDLDSLGMTFTRLDLAADDLGGLLDLDQISAAIRSGCLVTRWKRDSWEFIENGSGGRTWYFGSPRSDSRLRIYDKASEQGITGHWIRVELQLRRDRANSAAAEIIGVKNSWKERAAGWILGYLDFKTPGQDSNRSRWVTADWWLRFLDFAKKMRIFVSRWVPTIEDVEAWLKRFVT